MSSKDKLLSELMKEAQEGNSLSYETLLSEVWVFLQGYLNSKVYNKSQVDDIAQEVLIAIHKYRHTFNSDKSFLSWMLAIAHHKITDHLRVQYKQQIQELDETVIDPTPDALNNLINNQRIEILQQAINELDPKPREVISLLKFEGLKISEVSVRLKLSESNVKVIAHRAYQNLEIRLRDKL